MTENQNRLSDMLQVMSRNGWRVTEQRKTLAKIFTEHDGYLSPKEVYDKMSTHYPSVSLDTIYRNLRMLSEMGVLEHFYFMEDGLKFRESCTDHHHHHLICLNCEKTLHFEFCPMQKGIELPGQYKIMSHRFEVYGICEECQN
ncbi:Fur family transcriptional regulator [Alkalihalobacillus trypoxylicola]|uniref:Fur family transcriptional regulator n=1 Tax=Alkalihalobacillus trypoxylicola TaxID=519424 RepID=A0A162EP04_9BACI|nr:Fur family transcriptional regulator [Alkalihalobacillus trypoxylicola]KYG33378.1 Fur family transcriptional regulator [Alkalihalobacillus trypoxylicola]GAF66978.1 Fur family transcriptional regulator [Bacillus sp. TS-2]